MKQLFKNYTSIDHQVWEILFTRQINNLKDKACSEYMAAIEEMRDVLYSSKIAQFSQLDDWFSEKTKWKLECVPGLIPVEDFFELLSKKQFCSSFWLRSPKNLDYLEEPDMFHDIFGHIPLLSNSTYSDFIHEFGKLGKTFIHNPIKLKALQRLYWFTIEFGLIQQNGLKIYGAGILSSFSESNSCLQNHFEKTNFEMDEVITKDFHTDKIQNHYFVIQSFEALFNSIEELTNKWKENDLF